MGSGGDGESRWINHESGLGVVFCLLFFVVGRVIGFGGRNVICGFIFLPPFCGFIILLPEGGWGREKDIYRVHNFGGIFFLNAFFVTGVVGF